MGITETQRPTLVWAAVQQREVLPTNVEDTDTAPAYIDNLATTGRDLLDGPNNVLQASPYSRRAFSAIKFSANPAGSSTSGNASFGASKSQCG